jgi:rhodanese-related sulfurtransferase
MKALTDFVSRVKENAKPDETLMLMCRSVARSTIAVNMLAKSGFTKVYNNYDGMEVDTVSENESIFKGRRMVNGWKNSGCPWTYKLTPEHMLLQKNK